MILLKTRIKFFHSFEYRYVYEIKYINMKSYEEVILSITLGYMKYNSQFYHLRTKLKIAERLLLDTIKD